MASKKLLRAGQRVSVMVMCPGQHVWIVRGTVTPDGKHLDCGEVTAPNAEDDPTTCRSCAVEFDRVLHIKEIVDEEEDEEEALDG